MTRRPRPVLVAAVLACGALALAACATSSDPAQTTDASPPPTDSATPTPVPGAAAPVSRYQLDCEQLVPEDVIEPMFGMPVAPVDPLVTAASAGISIPRMTSVLSVGGLACEWSNGEPYNSQYGTNPAYIGVLVTVVPPQDAGWSANATSAGMPMAGSSCGLESCTMTRVASGAWIAAFGAGGSGGVIDPAAAELVADAAAASVDAASPPAAPAAIESAVPASECDAIVPTSTVEEITGTTGLTASTGAGGWSEWAEAMFIAEDGWCRWVPADAEESVASVDWVRGGRWAYERIEAAGALVPSGTADPVAVSAPDSSLLRCDPAYGVCAVDLVIGPDWLQVRSPDQGWAVDVAEQIAAGLAP